MNTSVSALSLRCQSLYPSKIREVAELGMGHENVHALWFGEGYKPTARCIVEAAKAALEGGDHFYQPNSGQAGLRGGIRDYTARTYEKSLDLRRITVTASGMQGLMITAQALTNPSDKVCVIAPAWPNIAQAFCANGAQVYEHTLQVLDARWHLDVPALLAALGRDTKVLVLNSPSNPTGWVIAPEQLRAIVAYARQHGIWLVADDVYSRLMFSGTRAPSVLDFTEPDDRVISINSFSKAWAMTGWRLGWIVAPSWMEKQLAMLTEFNIAGPAGFIQHAGAVALTNGEEDIRTLQRELVAAKALCVERLQGISRVECVVPEGAFYAFF
jgi:aspartate/methionine/tyrosine aminotransferase